MIKAVPLNAEGEPIGPAQYIPQHVWHRMVANRKHKLRWKEVKEGETDGFESTLPGIIGPDTKKLTQSDAESIPVTDKKTVKKTNSKKNNEK
jgi:hypothetical protein